MQETERVEKNNEDCAVCFRGLGGDALRFDHTLPIRLFQQAARQYIRITMKYTSNSYKSPGLQMQKGFDKSAPYQATKGAWGEFIRKIRAALQTSSQNSVSVQTEQQQQQIKKLLKG